MSALYGRITSDKTNTQTTKQGNRYLTTKAETWKRIVEVELWADGRCEVVLTDKEGKRITLLWSGNVNDLEV